MGLAHLAYKNRNKISFGSSVPKGEHNIMTIGILGAMKEEIVPFLELLNNDDITPITYAGSTYYKVHYKEHELVIAYGKIGKVNSAITALVMIEKFNASAIIFSGVAGAINPNLKVGDLIYANKLLQHDIDLSAFGHPRGFIPESKLFFETDTNLIAIAKKVAKSLELDLKGGVIATGDQFVADKTQKDWIAKEFGADALEMEGAAVANVCDSLNIPLFVLRAISDSADGKATHDFDSFLEESAKISAEFVFNMIKNV